MWFKRKTKNRRVNSGSHVLNVRLRSDQVRAGRLHFFGIALSAAFSLFLVVLVIWRGGEWILGELVYKNQTFNITEIQVETDGVIIPDQIKAWSNVKLGGNLLALELSRVKRDLEMIPLIRAAAIERVLPHTLKLRITEREPIAQVRQPHLTPSGATEIVVYHVDEEGYVMLPLDPKFRSAPPAYPLDQLPILTGIGASELRPGRKVEAAQVRAAVELVLAYSQSQVSTLTDLQRIDVASPEILEAYTSQGSQVTFSLSGFEQQLNRWLLIHNEFETGTKIISSIDLSIANNNPVRFFDASALPIQPVRPPKPLRPRRRHV